MVDAGAQVVVLAEARLGWLEDNVDLEEESLQDGLYHDYGARQGNPCILGCHMERHGTLRQTQPHYRGLGEAGVGGNEGAGPRGDEVVHRVVPGYP